MRQVDPAAHAVLQGFWLLHDFFEHEVRIAAFFDLLQVPLQLVDFFFEQHVVDGAHLIAAAAHNNDFPIVQVDHLTGVFDNGCSIRG
ncbi:hypothetical protein HRbin18_02344 [bacterium HR18]|nr:hypothetical protein HRbin18_02344 [bacterium HR18]